MKALITILRVWLSIFGIFWSIIVYAQNVVSFDNQVPYLECLTYRLNDNLPSCYLQLMVNDRYAMYVAISDGDMECEHILSFGSFSKKNDSVVLSDSLWGEEMVLIIKEDEFLVQKGFPFMIGKCFLFDKKEKSLLYSFSVNKDQLQTKQIQFENESKDFKKTDFGKYEAKQAHLSLTIFSDNQYLLFFDELLLSEGTVTINGNLIGFHDRFLNHSFYSSFSKGKICSCLLPSDVYGCTLNKVKGICESHQDKKSYKRRKNYCIE